MISTNEFKTGMTIEIDGNLWNIVDFLHVKPGKGSAFVKTKLKSITSGKGTEITYKSGESVDVVRVDYTTMQYLYNNATAYSFMNKNTYETVDVNVDVIGEDGKYLKEGLDVIMATHEGMVVAMQLPKKIQYTVKDAPPAVRGDSAAGNVTKEAMMDNGLKVNVPIFIKEGEEILVNTETGEYSGRAGE